MKNEHIILFLSVALFVAGCAGPEVRLEKVSQAVSAAEKKHDIAGINKLSPLIRTADLSSDRLRNYSDETLNLLFATLRKISFYSPDEENYALRLERVVQERVRRGKYAGEDVEKLFDAFVLSGLFDKAAALRQKFPSLPEVPEIISGEKSLAEGWRIYKVSEQGKKAELQPLSKSGQRMIMVMRPGCEFAEMAAEAIFADPELGPVFRANGLMLTRKFDPAGVAAIEQKFNFDAVYIARKSSDFTGFSLMRISPTFYFIKDGKILDEFSGWSNEDDGRYAKDLVRKGLAAIGIETK